jgi:glutaconyl-CoA/methylmalonyl-CoA decarboxylase subunit delta
MIVDSILKVVFDFSAVNTDNVTIFIVGYLVVFAALVLLYLVFFLLPKVLKMKRRRDLAKKGKPIDGIDDTDNITGEVNAAISMALYMHFNEAHDVESFKSTIKRVSRTYSPWSSKIYNVRNTFNRL